MIFQLLCMVYNATVYSKTAREDLLEETSCFSFWPSLVLRFSQAPRPYLLSFLRKMRFIRFHFSWNYFGGNIVVLGPFYHCMYKMFSMKCLKPESILVWNRREISLIFCQLCTSKIKNFEVWGKIWKKKQTFQNSNLQREL